MSILQEPTPWSILIGIFAIPYSIAYLVHLPNTLWVRQALFPLGLICGFWTIVTLKLPNPILAMFFNYIILKLTLDAGSHFAFWKEPPTYPPLPSPPPLSYIRRTTACKALNLLIDSNRLLSLQPTSPPHIPYFTALITRLFRFTCYLFFNEIATFPLYYTNGLNHPIYGFETWPGVWVWGWVMGLAMYSGTAMIMEMWAFVSVLSGLWTGEEWREPFFYDPLKSKSMVELWGKRYHRFMRDLYLRLAKPFEHGPKAIHILAVFFISAVYHTILYYPYTNTFPILPECLFWLGAGLGVIAERAFFKATGRKVGGWKGRIWMLMFFGIVSRPMVRFEVEHGWMKNALELKKGIKGEDCLLNWILYAVGLPGPLDWKKGV